MNSKWTLPLLLLCGFTGGSWAGSVLPVIVSNGKTTQKETRAYAGLAWTLGADKTGLKPDVVVGVQSVQINAANKITSGMDLNTRFKVSNGMALDSARLSLVTGKRDLAQSIGLGYSLVHKSPLVTVAAQGPYSRLALDYRWADQQWAPSFELLTIGAPERFTPGWACDNGGPITNPTPALNTLCQPLSFN